MSRADKDNNQPEEDEVDYKAPAQKSLNEIVTTDKDDESLEKYKKTLLGASATGEAVIIDAKDPRKVIPKSLVLMVQDRSDVELDLTVDKTKYMVGSYGPKHDIQSYTTPLEEAPSGMLARGGYTVKSAFVDDDKNEHLAWEWAFEIKKDW